MHTSYQRQILGPLLLAVFITGFCALLYQVVWQRVLGLFSGSDVISVTLVTSAFLAGLGVGSLLGSLMADRLSNRRAIQVYAACNVGIGLFAIASRFLYYDVLFVEMQSLAESRAVMFIVVFISLLIPTMLMGLSLPLLSRAVVKEIENASSFITWLYGFNTLGAGAGTLIGGWVIIGNLGFAQSLYAGAMLSLMIGLIAALLSNRFSEQAPHHAQQSVTLRWREVPRSVWVWCGMVFISGYVVISLEVIWFRILDTLLKSNAYTFAYVLTFFLVGDALGSLVGTRYVERIHNLRRAFLWLQGLIAFYSLAIILFLTFMTDYYPLNDYIRTSGALLQLQLNEYSLQWLVYLGLPSLLLLPPSFLIGFYFPLVQKAVQTDSGRVGQRVGLAEVSNILGNALGGIVTGVVLLHYLGTSTSLRLVGLIGLGFMLALLWEALRTWSTRLRLAGAGLALTLAALILFFPSNQQLWSRFHATQADEVFYVAEDSSGVSVIQGPQERVTIKINGRNQGYIPYTPTHTFLGALPALVHPDPRHIMVIGIGSTGTPYSVGLNASTESILAVEIVSSEIDVLEAYRADYPGTSLDAFFADSRYRILLGDGRRELVFSDQRFDIIEADAILPYSSHAGLLYSQEFFQQVADHLAEGGIMAQWKPTYRVTFTFVEAFPYVLEFPNYLLGSNQPIPYNVESVLARLSDPQVQAYLERSGANLSEIAAMIQEPIAVYTSDSPREADPGLLNTDLFPRDEYYLNN
jgi:predicted membrane-bound spermidine synthase